MIKIIIPLVLLLSSSALLAEEKVSFELLDKLHKKGACNASLGDLSVDRRSMSLVFLQEVLMGVSGENSYTKDIIGNYNSFSVGRNVDPIFDKLYQYAQRSDVKLQIKEDYNSMNAEIEAAAPRIMEIPEDTRKAPALFILCELHRMLTGQDYVLRDELENYSSRLNSVVAYKNINRLQELTKDFE